MYNRSSPLFFVCETPTHVGSGAELGIVDLPIQREKHTGFPKFEASSIKGAIREAFERKYSYVAGANFSSESLKVQRIFGFDGNTVAKEQKRSLESLFSNEPSNTKLEYAAAVGFSDARLLLFPIKSMRGVFAWVTCPKAWEQLSKDMAYSNVEEKPPHLDSELTQKFQGQGKACVAPKSSLLVDGSSKSVVLEEYVFTAYESDTIEALAQWVRRHALHDSQDYRAQKLKSNLVLVSDDDFADFVNLSTEVITRTRIDNTTGTVAKGALFTEEYLPAESILYSLMLTSSENRDGDALKEEDVFTFLNGVLSKGTFQIGGNATLGKGILSTQLNKGG